MPAPILGIDLGTTNSVVAVSDVSGKAKVLADANRTRIHPSVVSFHPSGDVLVGKAAKDRRIIDARNTVYSVKRLIGRTFDSPEVAETIRRVPFSIQRGDNNLPLIHTRAGKFAVAEISALVLDHLQRVARGQLDLGEGETRAVVTAPANFTDAQRAATANAGAIAGMKVMRVLSEPTAAALAYGHLRKLSKIIAVYDFGGGTFDISILKLDGDVFEVLGTAGDTYLGGDDIDDRMVDHLAGHFLAQTRVDLSGAPEPMMALREAAEQAKISLSRSEHAPVKVREIAYGNGGRPIDLELTVTRDDLLRLSHDIVERTFPVCTESLRMAGLSPVQVDDVLLVGGTTKIPYVRQRVAEFFQAAPRTDINPDEAVAIGAAIQANALALLLAGPGPRGQRADTDADNTVRRMRPTDRGMAVAEDNHTTMRSAAVLRPARPHTDDPTAPGNNLARIQPTKVPPLPSAAVETVRQSGQRSHVPFDRSLSQEQMARMAGDYSEVDETSDWSDPTNVTQPSEVELPAPRSGSVPDIRDVTPHSLGIGTVGGFCEQLIPRSTNVPTEIHRVFTSSRDNQDVVRIRVCQGESRRLVDNRVLGDLVLGGLAARPRGETKIEVIFRIDASGILRVQATDQGTGMAQNAELRVEGAQSPEQIAAASARLRAMRY